MLDRFPVDGGAFSGPVLVTGAGGCIGSWTLALLVNAGVKVRAFDLVKDARRPALLMSGEELARIDWRTGDIGDTAAVRAAASGVEAIIHLAALQVPFCKADPVAGARANVVGTVNVLEAARREGIRRISHASSVAAHGVFPGSVHLATLYGAYKLCDENISKVYFQDWEVPSVCLRPSVVAGIGRDQGLTSKTTVAILAAALGAPYTVPFTGPCLFLYAGEVASAFVRAVSREGDEAVVFDISGSATSVEGILDQIRKLAPDARIGAEGDPLPFPMDLSDDPVRRHLGDYGEMPLSEGIEETFAAFRRLAAEGRISASGIT